MDPMLAEFQAAVEGLPVGEPSIPIVSTVAPGARFDEGYWVRQVREPVRFADAVAALGEAGVTRVVELGPDGSLTAAVGEILPEVVAVPVLRRDRDEEETAVRALAALHVDGATVDWAELLAGTGASVVDLPTYPFRHERFWPPARPVGDATGLGLDRARHPLLGAMTTVTTTDPSVAGTAVLFTGRLSVATHPWLADHAVAGTVVVPGTALLELAIRAGDEVGCGRVADLALLTPLELPAAGAAQLQVWVGTDQTGQRSVTVTARRADVPDQPWTTHASGRLAETDEQPPPLTAAQWPPRDATEIDLTDFYDTAAADGFGYGPAFRGLRSAWRRDTEIFAEVALPAQARDAAAFGLHPALLDAAVQAVPFATPDEAGPRLPFAWEDVSLHATGATTLRVRITPRPHGGVALAAADTAGAPVLSVGSLTLRAPARADTGPADALFTVDLVPVQQPPSQQPEVHLLDRDADLAALPEPAPAVVVVDPDGAERADLATAAHERTARALDLVQAWLADERLDRSRLVFRIRPGDPGDAAVAGLVRSATAEHPGRFGLLDAHDPRDAATAAAFLTDDEPHLAVRDGRVHLPRLRRATPTPDDTTWDRDGTVLVTGATGGIGRELVRHLLARGFRHLLLAGRREPVADLAEPDPEVRFLPCDVTDRDAVHALVRAAGAAHPLTAVVHAAGAVDDGVVADLTQERLSAVLAPKVDGAWHLHEATRDLDLAGFVLFSSAAGVLGTPGQANYAAANAFLHGLVELRREAGLPAHAIAWGAWTVGLAAGLPDADRARGGFRTLSVADGLALFDRVTATAGGTLLAAPLDRAALRARPLVPPLLRELA
ncbi:type I polyketide synthase, partial [Actinophytocola xanthii]